MQVSRFLLSCILLASVSVLAQDSEPVRPEEGPESEESGFSLVITDLPTGQEEKTPSAAEGEQRRLAQLLATVKDGESLGSLDLAFLRRHRDAAVTALRGELKAGWKKAGTALETLISLGDAEARAQWFAEFRKGNLETREELLSFLAHDESGADLIAPRNREEEDVFRAALDPKNFALGAAFRINDRPGVPTLLLDQLAALPREDQWSVAGVITSGAWTREEARRFLSWTREQSAVVRDKELTALQEVVADVMEKRGETLEEAERLFLELHAKEPKELLHSQGMARAFCKGATPASRAVLDEIFKESKDPVVRGYALQAITRHRGADVLGDLEPLAADPKRAFELWDTLTFLAESGGREKVNAFVLRHFPELDDRGIEYVLRHGDSELLERAKASVDDRRPDLRFALEWKTKGRTLAGFFQRLKERNLITRVPTAAEIAQVTKGENGVELESDRVLRLLGMIGGRIEFDSEADVFPPPYDRLFDRLALFTGGAFVPRGLEQRAGKPAKEDEEPPLRIEFVTAGKRFTLKPAPVGDWFDLEAVQTTVNRALAVAGKEERLIAMESWGQEAAFVFGRPSAWREVAKEYAFPIAENGSDAFRQGKDYEKRVIESLEEKENEKTEEE